MSGPETALETGKTMLATIVPCHWLRKQAFLSPRPFPPTSAGGLSHCRGPAPPMSRSSESPRASSRLRQTPRRRDSLNPFTDSEECIEKQRRVLKLCALHIAAQTRRSSSLHPSLGPPTRPSLRKTWRHAPPTRACRRLR
eukprot:695385-Rhodomonas_salina.1